MLDILIVDDEADIRDLISDVFSDEGYNTRTAKNSVSAFEALSEKVPDAVILDIWLKDSELDGLGILETVRRKYPHVPVVMISGHGTIETAITSLKIGAYDYLEKPFKEDRLLHVVKRAIETSHLKTENTELKVRINEPNVMNGTSLAIIQLMQAIEKVAPTGSRVFVTGESGSGKEAVAKIIHDKSHRKAGPFIVLNTANISSDMIEHELFGTEDNTDINAPARKVGVFERADGGTLFIDEIMDIPLPIQGKFIRFLQDKTFKRVGGEYQIESDVRVIASTHQNIDDEIADGNLREDLYHRLNVVPIHVPALRERREDIPMICDYFLAHVAETMKLPMRRISGDALAALQAYDWPGNIRQMRNVIEWLLIMCPGTIDDPITSTMLPKEIFSLTPAVMAPDFNADIMSMKLRQAREVFERQYLVAQISRFGGNISRTASFIGMERSALHRKLKSLNVGIDEPVPA